MSEISHYIRKGDTVADIGCSEGIFSRSIIDMVSHIYLFEPNIKWNKALLQTFKDYKHKITIINKYVSNVDTDNTLRLDTYFKDKAVSFIKADIEGFEKQMLEGAKELFANRDDIRASICIYHQPEDAENFKTYFNQLGYKTSFTNGLMLLGKPLSFRKGVLYTERQSNSL